MPAISDPTRPANRPFVACYELLLFGCLRIGMDFWAQSEETHQSLAPQQAMNFNSFVTSLSSFELFSNLKWVLFPCYYWIWVRFPNHLWGRFYRAISDIPKWPELWTLTTLTRSAIWFQNQNDQQNCLLQCWHYLIIFIFLTSSTEWCLLGFYLFTGANQRSGLFSPVLFGCWYFHWLNRIEVICYNYLGSIYITCEMYWIFFPVLLMVYAAPRWEAGAWGNILWWSKWLWSRDASFLRHW